MLSIDRVIEHAEVVVAKRGADFRYNTTPDEPVGCAYVPNTDSRFPDMSNPASGSDVTGCIVGEILDRAGLLSDEVAGAEGGIHSVAAHLMLPIATDAVALLSGMQIDQDGGKSWGETLANAREFAEELKRFGVSKSGY